MPEACPVVRGAEKKKTGEPRVEKFMKAKSKGNSYGSEKSW